MQARTLFLSILRRSIASVVLTLLSYPDVSRRFGRSVFPTWYTRLVTSTIDFLGDLGGKFEQIAADKLLLELATLFNLFIFDRKL